MLINNYVSESDNETDITCYYTTDNYDENTYNGDIVQLHRNYNYIIETDESDEDDYLFYHRNF